MPLNTEIDDMEGGLLCVTNRKQGKHLWMLLRLQCPYNKATITFSLNHTIIFKAFSLYAHGECWSNKLNP